MKDNFDLKEYISSGRLLKESIEPETKQVPVRTTINEGDVRKRLNGLIKQSLTEKKSPKTKAKDMDIESAFTKEAPEQDEEIPLDVTNDDEQPVEANPVDTAEAPKPGYSKEEQEIQNSLKVAYDHAISIGDQKLATQIGNSLKFFIKTHVVTADI